MEQPRISMTMPFGKHKGKYIYEIPKEYLQWLWANVSLFDPLKSEVYFYLFGVELPGVNTVDSIPELDEISRIYKELARKWHPDMGGTKEAMQAINEFREMLKDLKVQ